MTSPRQDFKSVTLENSLAATQKVKMYNLLCDLAIPLLGIYPTEVCTYFQEKTCTRLFRVAKNEITQTSINKRMAK